MHINIECNRTNYTTPLKKNMRIYCNSTSCDYFITLILKRGEEPVPIYGTVRYAVSQYRNGGEVDNFIECTVRNISYFRINDV